MPTYKYVKTKKLKPTDKVELRIQFPQGEQGRAADHEVDLPGPNDQEAYNQCVVALGKGKDLIDDRVVVWSGIYNMLSSYDTVAVNYFVDLNGQKSTRALVKHSNPTEEDQSPIVKLTVLFKDKA